MIVERPKQRISVKERQDEKHYVNNMRYYIDVAVSANNMVETEDHIEASNGVVPKSTYDYVLRPLTGGDGTANNLPGVIRDTDFITPIREKNIGEYIELPNAFTVKVDDPNASILKSKEVADEVKPYIEQAIINVINSQQQGQQGQGMETGVPSTEQPDIQALVDDTLEKWVDERAVDSHLLIKSVLKLKLKLSPTVIKLSKPAKLVSPTSDIARDQLIVDKESSPDKVCRFGLLFTTNDPPTLFKDSSPIRFIRVKLCEISKDSMEFNNSRPDKLDNCVSRIVK